MFTPARPLTLVHAVRRPLLAAVGASTEGRTPQLGRSAIVLDGQRWASIDKSTERVTLTAGWTDTVDDLTLDVPVPRSTRGRAGQAAGQPGRRRQRAGFERLRAELHDTKRHLATIYVEAFSSFASYFTEESESR